MPNQPVTKENAIYPGEYIPLPETEILLGKPSRAGKHLPQLLVSKVEYKDHIKAEIFIPAAKKENILIRLKHNNLMVMVLYESYWQKQLVQLPSNANAELANAVYKEGILSLYIPKAEMLSRLNTNMIVVY